MRTGHLGCQPGFAPLSLALFIFFTSLLGHHFPMRTTCRVIRLLANRGPVPSQLPGIAPTAAWEQKQIRLLQHSSLMGRGCGVEPNLHQAAHAVTRSDTHPVKTSPAIRHPGSCTSLASAVQHRISESQDPYDGWESQTHTKHCSVALPKGEALRRAQEMRDGQRWALLASESLRLRDK